MLIAKDTGWVCADCRVLCHNKMQHLQSSISRVHEEMCEMQKQMTGLKCELEDIKHAPTTLNSAHSLPATQPTDTEAVVSKVLHDAHRRRKNVIISGLPEAVGNCEADRRAADLTMFERLCEEHLDVKPATSHLGCRRLGKLADHTNKPRKLLIYLNSETGASSVLNSAKLLRRSSDAEIAANVFINPDLSPTESKIAFDLRQQKRARLTNGHRRRGSRPHITDTVQSTASSVAHSQPYSNHNADGLSNTDLTNYCAEPVVNVPTVQATRVNLSAVHLTASTAAAATSSSSICTTTTTCSIVTPTLSSAPTTTTTPTTSAMPPSSSATSTTAATSSSPFC